MRHRREAAIKASSNRRIARSSVERYDEIFERGDMSVSIMPIGVDGNSSEDDYRSHIYETGEDAKVPASTSGLGH